MNTPNESLQKLIGAYGHLKHEAGMYHAAGRQIPPKILSDMQKIEAYATANMSPDVLAYAEREADKVMYQQRENAEQRVGQDAKEDFNADLDLISRKMTKGVFGEKNGLPPEQWRNIRDGKNVELLTGAKAFDFGAAEKASQEKYGVPYKELKERLDDTVKLKDVNPERYKKQLEEYDLTDDQVTDWGEKGGGLTLGIHERQARIDEENKEPMTMEVEPDDQDQRKAQLQDAWMEVENDDNTLPINTVSNIDQTYLENEDITGDVARAFAAHEADDEVRGVV